MPADRSFPASFDSTTKIISTCVTVVLLAAVVLTRNPIVMAVAALVLLSSFAYSPRSYAVSGDSIIVRRWIGSVRFPLDGIEAARNATNEDIHGCMRLWGNDGLFGYYGLYQTSRGVKTDWYVTNRDHAVVVTAGGKTALFSPDDVTGFLDAIRVAAPTVALVSGAHSEPARAAGISISAWICVAGAVALMGILSYAFLFAPGPPEVTVTPSGLTIHDRFYPVTLRSNDVDVVHIRVIDLASDPEWRPTARTNGFANAHYRSGWFHTANGQRVRLYSTGANRVVLLPPNGAGNAVLLEVKQPEEFAAQLQRAWASH